MKNNAVVIRDAILETLINSPNLTCTELENKVVEIVNREREKTGQRKLCTSRLYGHIPLMLQHGLITRTQRIPYLYSVTEAGKATRREESKSA